MNLTSTLVAVTTGGATVVDPSVQQLKEATSVHVLAFSSLGDLLVVESEGDFNFDTWEEVHAMAKKICIGEEKDESNSEDMSMDSQVDSNMQHFLRSVVQKNVAKEQEWKQKMG